MGALLDTLKLLKPWQLGVLVAALVGAAFATYGGYILVGGSNGTGLGENQQLITVQYGDLVNQVSTNGSLVFPNRETLTFGTQGTVGEVLVEEGQQVAEGQMLANLDAAAATSLEKSVVQARVSLRNAQDALAEAKEPHSALELAQAEADLASTRLSLESAQEALDKLLQPTAEEIAQAEAAVTTARISLGQAEDALAGLLEPTPLDMAQAEASVINAKLSLESAQEALDGLLQPTAQEKAQAEAVVTSAEISLESAQEALDAVISGPTEEEFAKAQFKTDSASTSLAIASADLSLTQKDWKARVEMAQEALDTALEGYQGAFQKWLGVNPEEVDGNLDPDVLLDLWSIDLASLFDPSSRFRGTNQAFQAEGLPRDDPATPWSELVVYIWMNLVPGEIAPICGEVTVTLGTQCVKEELEGAWDVLEAAGDGLNTVETQAGKAMANAENTVAQAEENLAAAQGTLDDMQEPSDPLEIQSKDSLLELAQATLETAQENLDKLVGDPDPLEEESKRVQVAVAQANLARAEEALAELTGAPDPLVVDSKQKQIAVAQAVQVKAEEDLAKLENGADPLDLEAHQTQVAVAQARLDQAQEDLGELRGSVDPLEVAVREADVGSAEFALETALENLEGVVLRSLIAGVVLQINVEAGQSVNPNTPVVEVADPTVIELDGIVDEIDVLFVRQGARAEVIMDALPGQVLEGTVSSIEAAARNQQGVVSYPIRVRLQLPEGVGLLEGLSATASIVIREDLGVLLVPIQAIVGTFEQPLVRVKNGGNFEERAVALGNSDDFWTVVTGGLQEGDQVVIEATQASTDPFAQFRQQLQAGGGGGGFQGGGGGFPGGRRFPGGQQQQDRDN